MAIEIIESQGDDVLNRGQLSVVGRLDNAVQLLAQKEAEFAVYLDELKSREEEIANLKKNLFATMTEKGVKKLESEHLIITVVQPKPRHSIDMKKLSAVNPALYAEVDEIAGKDTEVSGYVKLTTKD